MLLNVLRIIIVKFNTEVEKTNVRAICHPFLMATLTFSSGVVQSTIVVNGVTGVYGVPGVNGVTAVKGVQNVYMHTGSTECHCIAQM